MLTCGESIRKRLVRVLFLCAGLYVLAGIGCASCQRRLIYFPPVFTSEQVDERAKGEGLERWKTAGGECLGWKRLAAVQPAKGQVLITHGNADCAFQCGHFADVIQQVAPLDVFILEFPGYADRPGKPSEHSVDEAAAEAIQILPTNTPLYLVGESLGTGVATYLAGRFPQRVAGIALLAPYNRLADVAQWHIRIFPVSWILRDRFPAEEDLRNYQGRLAVLVGGKDIVVPAKFGRRLYDGYTGPKQLWEFPDMTHDSLMVQPPEIWRQIVGFWNGR